MLREIFRALRRKDALGEMFEQVGKMLDLGQWMFVAASQVLSGKSDWSAVADELYAKDREINKFEQGVRERIVTHLGVGRGADLAACMVLMNVVKDAERIGDYCKNILEVGKFYRREYTHPEYAGPLQEVREAVTGMFADAKVAFLEEDGDLTRKLLADSNKFTKECERIIRQLLTVQEQLAPDEAVAYVLMARHYKRVAAHLANIATSVVCPVPMLDYHTETPS